MPSYEPFEKLTPTTVRLDPVPRADVEAYLEEFGAVSSPLKGNGDLDEMNWKAWRDLRAPDYFIQWNLKQGRFQLTADEYIERWQWSIKSGHVWDALDSTIHIIDTGFIVEGILRSRHTDADGNHVTMPMVETFHLRDGLAVYSCEYVDGTFMTALDADIPYGW